MKAVSGMPTLQFSLVSIYELVHEGLLSIEQLVQKMCHAPAQLYQISQRGFIRPGYQADLVLLNPHKEWTVTTDCIESKCGWSPMEGRTFHAQVEKTFVNGTAVYENGKVNKAHRGQALRFESFPEAERAKAAEAMQLHKEAVRMLNKIDGKYKVYAIYRLMEANAMPFIA